MKKVVVSRNAIFDEQSMLQWNRVSMLVDGFSPTVVEVEIEQTPLSKKIKGLSKISENATTSTCSNTIYLKNYVWP